MKRSLLFLAVLLAVCSQIVLAQEKRTVSGTVQDGKGTPLPGVNVIEKGTTNGAITKDDGQFTLTVKPGATLVVSMVGYTRREIPTGTNTSFNVTLQEDSKGLGEVVVTALGVKQNRKSLGYAITSIKGEDLLVAGATLNPVQALYGKAAGVGIVAGSAGPMGGINIKIRGAAGLIEGANTRPLFVVDGAILHDSKSGMSSRGYDPLHSFDYGSGINDINPEDIESIEILKGAKAAVLYGAEGANGVVLITTKSGKNAKGFGVTVSQQLSIEQPVNYINFQNEYGSGESMYDMAYDTINGVPQRKIVNSRFNFGPKFNGEPVKFFDGSIRPYSAVPNNFMDLFRNGKSNRTNVAIAGNNDKGSMRLSYTNSAYDDIFENSWQKQNTFSFSGNMRASKFATFEVTTNLYNTTTNNRRPNLESLVAWGMNRDYPLSQLRSFYKDANGFRPNYEELGLPRLVNNLFDVWWNQLDNTNLDKKTHLVSSAKATLNFLPNLSLVTQAAIDYTNVDFTRKDRVTRVEPQIAGGFYGRRKENYIVQNYTSYINYDQALDANKDFHMFLMAGGNVRQENGDTIYVSTSGGLGFPGWYSLDNELGWPGAGDKGKVRGATRSSKSLYSVFGSAQFSWKDALFVEIQGRNDWSSTLPPGNNSYFYPGVSVAWNFDKFIQIPKLQHGKLRVGWADVGRDAPYVYFAWPSLDIGRIPGYNNAVTIGGSNALFANQLKPERKREYEIGFEGQFFKGNRLSVDFSYYTNNVYDQLMAVSLSAASGANQIRINAGNVKNWGYELALKGIPIMTNNFTLTVGGTAANQRSKILKLYPGIKTNPIGGNAGFNVVATEGRPINDIQMFDYLKDEQGNKIVDSKGLYQLGSNLSTVSNTQSKVLGGFFTDFRYKNISLHIGLDYKFGGTIFSYTNYYLTGMGITENTLAYRDESKGGMAYYIDKNTGQNVPWQHNQAAPANAKDSRVYHDGMVLDGVKSVTGPDGSVKYEKNDIITSSTAYYQTYINDLSTGWGPDRLYKNDYIKVREISLDYTLPHKFTQRLHLQSVKVMAAVRNLFYLYKTLPNVDVESTLGVDSYIENSFYPSTRSFNFGINVSF